MSYAHWHVGMKVVCKTVPSREQLARCPGANWPLAGAIYSIREIFPHPYGADYPLITLAELDNRHLIGVEDSSGLEPAFGARNFRPVQPRKTSIEVFHRIRLNPSIRIREDA